MSINLLLGSIDTAIWSSTKTKPQRVDCFSKTGLMSHLHGSVFFNNFLSLSVFSESYGRNFATYCIAPRNDFNYFLLFGDFNLNNASTFSSFGFPFSANPCPSYFACFMKNSNLLFLLDSQLFPKHQKSFSSVLCCLRVLQLLCQLTKPLWNIRMFSLLFLQI